MRVTSYLTLPVLLLASSAIAESSRTANQISQDANKLLAAGSYIEAARAYGEAIDLDPSSYANYYKRATAYLSAGRHSAALDDFDKILEINPAFAQAHLQKAKILAKEGEFEKAQSELKAYGKSKVDTESEELARSLTLAAGASKSAHKARKNKDWNVCVDHATKALEVGPNSGGLRELRVECATELGDVQAVYGDLNRLASLNPSSTLYPPRLAYIAYFLLGSESATTHIKQCLHYDPDSKPCKAVHKLIKRLEKDTAKARNFVEGNVFRQAIRLFEGDDGLLARFDTALESAGLADQFRPKESSISRLELYSLACKAIVGLGDLSRKGMKWCEITLELDENNVDGLVAKGEKLLKDENWDEAVRILERAFENTGRSRQDVLERLQKAQRLLKVSKQKDYYKVLGVGRDADDRTIKKAFRKAAKIAHPDVGGSEEKMAALNEAYEVLSDPDLRQRYDNGDDPNDPHQGGGHNPFAHHGGGMPFQFFQQGGGGGFPGGGFPGGGQKFQFQWGG
ncbi:uncharacterized protein I206_101444 [Kwoniella pini CBS 10737]|uniref:Tetratricopeptide repeat and J domain-containing co-chaperone DNJ1 n=1 Tax=Kwoniella pini CBS 10737 TaxID=1296096 RepID=A0A1B9HWP7_9TREE|nr:co-chaperone [Kwoniella pini CBS 10737]OCF47680.1 co-chaperone [Kwoniella pini CBS 10737]